MRTRYIVHIIFILWYAWRAIQFVHSSMAIKLLINRDLWVAVAAFASAWSWFFCFGWNEIWFKYSTISTCSTYKFWHVQQASPRTREKKISLELQPSNNDIFKFFVKVLYQSLAIIVFKKDTLIQTYIHMNSSFNIHTSI